jgi:hypothetical protein
MESKCFHSTVVPYGRRTDWRTGITETQLKGAPKYGNDNAWNWGDPARTRSVNDYYGVAS